MTVFLVLPVGLFENIISKDVSCNSSKITTWARKDEINDLKAIYTTE